MPVTLDMVSGAKVAGYADEHNVPRHEVHLRYLRMLYRRRIMSGELIFEKFQSLKRMKRECVITEKIDGTNAQICFDDVGNMLVGSRKRQIWPEGTIDKPKGCDNQGFAQWAYSLQDELFNFLGAGRHFGEWCGAGIQRKYGLTKKYFLLFNTNRFGVGRQEIPVELLDKGLGVVPVLYQGVFTTDAVDKVMEDLKETGSHIADFDNPEGIVVYHTALRDYFKVTYEHDMTGKGPNRQSPS